MNKSRKEYKLFKVRKRTLALGMTISFVVGVASFPVANAATQYVTMQQRKKDLTDIAKQIVLLQGRISYLESCIRDLRVNKYSSFGDVEC